jgi:hypothetical protein
MKTLIALAPALVLCLIFFGTPLETASYGWLVATPLFIDTVVRGPLGPDGLRWVALGALVATTWNLFTTLAQQRGWSPGQLSSLAVVGHGADLTAVILAAAGLIIGIRSGILALRRPPSAQE